MKTEEKEMYADFIMAMRQRARAEHDVPDEMSENHAAEELYGDKYLAIRKDFQERVSRDLKGGRKTPMRRKL